MNKYLLNTIGVALLVLIGTWVWAGYQLGTASQSATPVVGKIGVTLDKINSPTGTLVLTNKAVNEFRSLIVHADLVARHEQQQLTTWDTRGKILFDNLNGGVTDLRGTVQSLGKTANAATGVLDEGRKTLSIVNNPETGLPELEDNSNGAINDLRNYLRSKAVQDLPVQTDRFLKAGAGTMENIQSMSEDGKYEIHKLTHPTKKMGFKAGLWAVEQGVRRALPVISLF